MIKVDHVTVRIGDREVLQDVSFEAVRGDYVAILGPNGGGKSTMLKTILGLHKPSSGTISVGESAYESSTTSIGYVPQIKSLDRTFPARSLELVLTSTRRRWPAFPSSLEKARATEALEEVGAGHLAMRSVSSLSGGELQRVYLARAIIQKPTLLLLDEPESGIDISGAKDLYTLLEAHHRSTETCILMVTHDWDVAYHHASHALLINGICYGFGPRSEALTEEAIRSTFGHVGHKHAMLAGSEATKTRHDHA